MILNVFESIALVNSHGLLGNNNITIFNRVVIV